VHIKDTDASKSVRYRIDLAGAAPAQGGTARRITLDFSAPESKSLLFSWARVGEVHFVIDDAREDVTARGSLVLGGFRLEPSPAAGADPASPATQAATFPGPTGGESDV